MTEDNATRTELLEALASQAARLARVEAERDRLASSCGHCGELERAFARLHEAEAERDRLRDALSGLLSVVDWANASLASGEDEQWIHGQLMRAAGHARTALKDTGDE